MVPKISSTSKLIRLKAFSPLSALRSDGVIVIEAAAGVMMEEHSWPVLGPSVAAQHH